MNREKDTVYTSHRNSGWNRPKAAVRKKRRRRPFLVLTLLLLAAFSVVYGMILFTPAAEPKKVSAIQSIKAPITKIISTHPDYNISVSIVDTKTNEAAHLGYGSTYTAASTTKLLTAALTMSEVEAGNLSLDDYINGSLVSWHLQQMINQSNNQSWKTLNQNFGQEKVEAYAKQLELDTYNYTDNLISAKDMSKLLTKLYRAELVNKANTKLILGHMRQTNDDSFIPAIAETTKIKVYHKYGWLESNIHDVAILESKDKAWVLAIYTNPKNNQQNATISRDIIHMVTELVTAKLTGQPGQQL
ncbi:MAG: serine hydrolase [Patescibacteria group bacterium]